MDLPIYSSQTSSSALPQYDPPPYLTNPSPNPTQTIFSPSGEELPTFTIGKRQTKSLVKPSDLHASLLVLGAFHRLQQHIVTLKPSGEGSQFVHSKGEKAWELYVARAVYRFERWVLFALRDVRPPERAGISVDEIPPLDVLMVWHTYLLNPRIYYEDGLRVHSGLLSRGGYPLHNIASLIDPETQLPYQPSQERISTFQKLTGLPFQANEIFSVEDTAEVACPSCTLTLHLKWITTTGNGYAQEGFATTCPGCKLNVDKLTFSVAKFSRDVGRVCKHPKTMGLAGMLLQPKSGTVDLSEFQDFNDNLIRGVPLDDPAEHFDARHYARYTLEWKFDKVESVLRQAFMGRHIANTQASNPAGLNRIISFYRASGMFSVDLMKAVLRQHRFVEKMAEIGWSAPERFSYDDTALSRCANQYHAFLHIMACNPGTFLVPTLAIDLAWHTHQLSSEAYRRTTLDLLNTIVDHDDNVEQEHLAASYDKTAQLWKNEFGVPYSVCGCTQPPSTRVIESVSPKWFSKKGKGKGKADANPRPDLLSREVVDADETHPSEHPSVILVNYEAINEKRSSRNLSTTKRNQEDRRAYLSGKADQWTELIVPRKDRPEHLTSFLTPMSDTHMIDGRCLGHGQCIMGIGKAGLCTTGNFKQRAVADLQDRSWGGITYTIGGMGGCGG